MAFNAVRVRVGWEYRIGNLGNPRERHFGTFEHAEFLSVLFFDVHILELTVRTKDSAGEGAFFIAQFLLITLQALAAGVCREVLYDQAIYRRIIYTNEFTRDAGAKWRDDEDKKECFHVF